MRDAREFVSLAASVLVHVAQSLKAAHTAHEHVEWIQVVHDVGELLDQATGLDDDEDDEEKADELLKELLAIAEAVDPKLTIERNTSGEENDSEDDSEEENNSEEND